MGLNRIISTIMLLATIAVIGLLFYKVMIGFFVPLFVAALLVVIFSPLHRWICHRIGDRSHIAAGLTTAIILTVVLLPLCLVIAVAAAQGARTLRGVNQNSISLALIRMRQNAALEMPDAGLFRTVEDMSDKIQNAEQPADVSTIRSLRSAINFLHSRLDEGRQGSAIPQYTTAIERIDSLQAALADLKAADEAYEQILEQARSGDSLSETVPQREETPPPRKSSSNDEKGLVDQASDDTASSEEIDLMSLPPDQRQVLARQRYQQLLVQTANSVTRWEDAALGGGIRAQIVKLVNPSDARLKELLTQCREYLQPTALSLTTATGSLLVQFLVGLSIVSIAVHFFLVDGPSMLKTMMRLSPLDDRYEKQLLDEFGNTSRAIVLATSLAALAQGALATIG
ncbi:MAG: hypothetical protein AAFP90_17780, partial [Planctomycetota bacterium]